MNKKDKDDIAMMKAALGMVGDTEFGSFILQFEDFGLRRQRNRYDHTVYLGRARVHYSGEGEGDTFHADFDVEVEPGTTSAWLSGGRHRRHEAVMPEEERQIGEELGESRVVLKLIRQHRREMHGSNWVAKVNMFDKAFPNAQPTKKTASAGDEEMMRGIMSAIRVARATYGELEKRRGFLIDIGGGKVPVVNSMKFASPACLSRSLVEGAIPEGDRPRELGMVSPASPVVAMKPSFTGAGYDTILFHELVHSQQIVRMWRRRDIDTSGMSHQDVVEGWRDRDIPMPKSQHVDEEYGSVHAEIHAYMMHVAYAAIRKAAARMEGGVALQDAEERAVAEASSGASAMMQMLRGATATLADDPRFSAFMRGPAAEHGVGMSGARTKERWRMSDREWDDLNLRMGRRMEYLVRKMVRQLADRTRRRDAV